MRIGKVIDKVDASRAVVEGTAAALALLTLAPFAAPPLAAQPVAAAPAVSVGPDAAACVQGTTALRVHVGGFRDRVGLLRVSTYAASPETWLVPGKFVRRIDMPVPPTGEVDVCVALAAPGRYGVAVLHDRNGDHHANIFSDGGGFSNNPRFGLSKPAVERVAFGAGAGVTTISIMLKYL